MNAVTTQILFDASLNIAVAEINECKRLGPMHSEAMLITARHMIDKALDECKRTRKGESYEYPRQEI